MKYQKQIVLLSRASNGVLNPVISGNDRCEVYMYGNETR
jgi:hypothetical protein